MATGTAHGRGPSQDTLVEGHDTARFYHAALDSTLEDQSEDPVTRLAFGEESQTHMERSGGTGNDGPPGVQADTTTMQPARPQQHDDSFHKETATSNRNPSSIEDTLEDDNLNKDVEKGAVATPTTSSNDDKEETSGEKGKEEPQDPYLVNWDGPDDPENPQNFSKLKKWYTTMILSSLTFTVVFSSSIFSSGEMEVAKKFGISEVVATLGLSLFVLGFAFGPLIWGPFSELFGRTLPLYTGFFVFLVFQIPVAVAQNLQTIMICRFFAGLFGCAPLTVVGGALADIWDPVERGVAIAIFSAATFIGPVAGPIVGGFVTQSYLGWRWTAWLTLFLGAFNFTVALILVPETYAPVLLKRRANKLRFETKNWALHAKIEENRTTLSELGTRYAFRPIQMLILEPILLLITIYMSLIYGILYLFFEAYPISFQEQRGWNNGVGALPFLGILIGVVLGAIIVSWVTKTRFKRKMQENRGVVPEERLIPMILGAFLLPFGLFWFAWTSFPSISWVPQVIAGVPIGMGVFMIFMQGLNYIIDCYLMNANSGIAGNTLMRSFLGAGFPLVAIPMYHNLGVPWATSLLAFLCVAFIPVPILFYIYGKKLRSYSKFVPSL